MQPVALDIQPIVVWAVAASQLLTLGLTLWNLFMSSTRANGRRLDLVEAQLQSIDRRLSKVEGLPDQMPTKESQHQVELNMARVQGQIATLGEAIRGQQQILERIEAVSARHEQHLLSMGQR